MHNANDYMNEHGQLTRTFIKNLWHSDFGSIVRTCGEFADSTGAYLLFMDAIDENYDGRDEISAGAVVTWMAELLAQRFAEVTDAT